jgi:integrase
MADRGRALQNTSHPDSVGSSTPFTEGVTHKGGLRIGGETSQLIGTKPIGRGEGGVASDGGFMTVAETATFLHVSQSWVRRHISELPAGRYGRLIRIDGDRLKRTIESGKSLRPERAIMPRRYQRGSVFFDNKRKQWIGRFRLDTPDGGRTHPKRVIGSKEEYPTKTAARDKLDEMRRCLQREVENQQTVSPQVNRKPSSFSELVERWKAAEGTALGDSTLKHYSNALRAQVIPQFGTCRIEEITREEVQKFLNEKAKNYSKSSLRSMRVTLSLTLKWALQNNWIPSNPVEQLRLPKKTGGRRIVRVILQWKQIAAIMDKMDEPYRTLALFLALVPKRIEEAIALRPSDLDEHNILHIRRALYERKVVEFEPSEYERIPLDSPAHAELVKRLRQLGDGHDLIFRSRRGTPIDPHNGLMRKLHPACKTIGIRLGGWHDFRHTFNTAMRRAGVHAKVRSAALGHNKRTGVLADDVYDHASEAEVREALVLGANWMWQEESIQKTLLSNQLCPQMFPEAHLQSGRL